MRSGFGGLALDNTRSKNASLTLPSTELSPTRRSSSASGASRRSSAMWLPFRRPSKKPSFMATTAKGVPPPPVVTCDTLEEWLRHFCQSEGTHVGVYSCLRIHFESLRNSTKHMPLPNAFRTAGCVLLLERALAAVGGQFERLFQDLQAELLQVGLASAWARPCSGRAAAIVVWGNPGKGGVGSAPQKIAVPQIGFEFPAFFPPGKFF